MSRRPGSVSHFVNIAEIPAERRAVSKYISEWLAAHPQHSLTYLETLTHISRQGLSDILNCKRLPKPDTCKILASALGISPETLLIAAGHMPTPDDKTLLPVGDAELVGYFRSAGLLGTEKLAELKEFFRYAYADADIDPGAPAIRPVYARPYTRGQSSTQSTEGEPDGR